MVSTVFSKNEGNTLMRTVKKNKPLVSVIIVNWNGRSVLSDCLSSLFDVSYRHKEVLFVDNASSDGSVDYVRRNFPQVTIVQNKQNLGYAGGHDIALRKARGDAILLLNSDTIVQKNLIDALVHALYADDKIGAVQPTVALYPQKELIDSIGAFFIPNGDLYHYGREKNIHDPKYHKPMDIFSVKGVAVLLRREVLDKTGLFDKDFFAYFEETDLSMRIWMAGYTIRYTPDTTVFHKGGIAAGKMSSSYILFHAEKNRIATYIKNLSVQNLIRVLPVQFFLYQLAFAAYIGTAQWMSAWAIQRALLWNITHLAQTMQKRKYTQRHIRAQSDDYLPLVTRNVRIMYYYRQFFGGMDKYED